MKSHWNLKSLFHKLQHNETQPSAPREADLSAAKDRFRKGEHGPQRHWMLLSVCSVLALGGLLSALQIHSPSLPKKAPEAPHPSEVDSLYKTHVTPAFQMVNWAMAEGVGSSPCEFMSSSAWSSCLLKKSAYSNSALNFFNSYLCILNKGFPSQIETSLCHFNQSLGMNPDKQFLPITLTKQLGSDTVELLVETPTEPFATLAGYDAKGTVKLNGAIFMVLYWSGTDKNTKGFLISGARNLINDGIKRPAYAYWDRTDSEAQFIKIFAANYTLSFLSSVSQGDRVLYGEALYKASTKEFTAQTLSIEAQQPPLQSYAGCFKMVASGIKGGTVSIAKTDDSHALAGHAPTQTTTDGTEMDASVLIDSEATAEGSGFYTSPEAAKISVSFKKSCNDVFTAQARGKPFQNSDVSYDATPLSLFGSPL